MESVKLHLFSLLCFIYPVYVKEGCNSDQLQMSRKLCRWCNAGNMYLWKYSVFSGCSHRHIPMLIILTKLEWCDKVNFSPIKFCEEDEFKGYFLFSKWGNVQGCSCRTSMNLDWGNISSIVLKYPKIKHRSPHLEYKLIFCLVMNRQDRQDLNPGNKSIIQE